MNKNKIKMLEKLRQSRVRMRDVAAGVAQAAANKHNAAEAERQRIASELENLLNDAPRLLEGGSLRHVFELEVSRASLHYQVNAAVKEVKGHAVERDRVRDHLMAEERKLRTTEKQLERTKQERDKEQSKLEQKLSDDLVSSRAARKE